MNFPPVLLGAGLLVAVILPAIAAWLEARMVSHLLLQIPALALAGWLIARGLPVRAIAVVNRCNDHGIPGILIVTFTALFWMIPRVLDASLQGPLWAISKYVSLPFLIGAPLALSWPCMHPIARGFVQIELLAMLLRFGWLYLVSPIRLCSYYSLGDQVLVGKLLLIIATVIAMYWVIALFTLQAPRGGLLIDDRSKRTGC